MTPTVIGTDLRPIQKTITQSTMTEYSTSLGAANPIHFDPAFAARTQFGGPIASGPITLTLIDELMAGTFPREWLRSGWLKVTFIRPVRPGDQVSLGGKIDAISDSATERRVTIRLECINQRHEPILVGTAEVTVGPEPPAGRTPGGEPQGPIS